MAEHGLNWDMMNGSRTRVGLSTMAIIILIMFYPITFVLLGTDWVKPWGFSVALEFLFLFCLALVLYWKLRHPPK